MQSVQITSWRSRGPMSKYAAGSRAGIAASPLAAVLGGMTATGAVRGPGVGSFASARLRGRTVFAVVVAVVVALFAVVVALFAAVVAIFAVGGGLFAGFLAATAAASSGAPAAGGVARAAARGAGAGFASASRGAAALRVRGARGAAAGGSGTSCGGAIGFGEAGRRGNSCGTRYVNVLL
jgi:hypothetical protein